ncbi:hypothetical protein [Hymenobacter sp. IS2118]|uniref:hypothetical protein n=1 Tax=Hymenobacter sp. IS2118 TaxID=1505605 RepID=UPI0005543A27|nr:hypothetical protein [Hymenobacter sp. IS2118]
MSYTDAQIVAALLTKAECDRFTLFLTSSKSTAEYQRLGLTNSVTNFGSAEGRAAEISRLTAQNAARTLEVAAIADPEANAKAKAELLADETRLNNLVLKTYRQGGDDKAERMFDANTADARLTRAETLLPLVATRKPALPA